MSTDSPDHVVRQFIQLLSDKNIDAACELVTADCEYDNVPIGKVYGPEGIHSILDGYLGNCETVDWQILAQVASGDLTNGTVMNERNDRCKMHGRWVDVPVAGLFEVREGRITLWRDYFDKTMLFTAMTPPE